MLDTCRWIALGYNVPIEPSRNRVYVWRKLKEFGAEYFRPGVAILPNTKDSRSQFQALAAKIREMGGDSTLVELRFVEQKDESAMIDRFRRQSEAEYQELLEDCRSVLTALKKQVTLSSMERYADDVKKMMRQYRKVKSRDYFAAELSKDIEYGFSQIIEAFRGTATDFSTQLRRALEKK